jgi:hypothetical protein
MSKTKEMDRHDLIVATALRNGELSKCEDHDEVFSGSGGKSETGAQLLREYKAGMHKDMFSSESDVLQQVMSAINDYPADECPSCERQHDN